MASHTRKPKPVEVKPGQFNTNPSDTELAGEPAEMTLEEARAEEHLDPESAAEVASQRADSEANDEENGSATADPPSRARVQLNTKPIRATITTAAMDYLTTAGMMPSILDLFEIVSGDPAFAHLIDLTDEDGTPLFTPRKLASQVNRIRKDQQADIAEKQDRGEDTADLMILPPLARTQRTLTPRVSDAEALARLVAERVAKLNSLV